MNIPAFKSERFVITVEAPAHRRKVFQVLFRKRDGSVFVAFPYYVDTPGILSLATLRAGIPYPASFSLRDGGKVTGHKVKFSHHPDGRVHFSQDGKIRTQIVKSSTSLTEADGHLFTIQLQGLGDFAAARGDELQPVLGPKKTILNFRFEPTEPEAIKFVGHWYSESALVRRISQFGSKPWFASEKPDGTIVMGALIENSFLGTEHRNCLLLTCEPIPKLDKDRFSTVTFIGGFDPRTIALNHEMDTSFLALAYPATGSYDDLVRQIGSVDMKAE